MTQGSPAPLTGEQLQAILDGSPFIHFYGIRLRSIDREANTIVLEMRLRPELERGPGTGQWHGGTIAGLIDTAGDFALVVNAGAPVPTINLRIDYLRPATTAVLAATARVRRSGRTVAVVDVDVEDEQGRLVAVGRGCFSTTPG